MLPEDCRVVIGQDMVDRFRTRGRAPFAHSDSMITDHLDTAINGPEQEHANVTLEMIHAGQAIAVHAGTRLPAALVDAIFRAMDAARPKAEK